jgi:ferredoxin-nitrate reductase
MVTLLCNQYKRKCARKAKVTDLIKRGLFSCRCTGVNTNDLNLTNNVTNSDPVSKEPDFKYTIVSVAKYVKPFDKIAVVGAELQRSDLFRTIEISQLMKLLCFRMKKNPFYNRFYYQYVTA